MDTYKEENKRLEAQVAQLKQDLGRRRSDGYTVMAVRGAIDGMIADIERAGWLPDCEPSELGVLRHLRQIAYRDHASDMFGKLAPAKEK